MKHIKVNGAQVCWMNEKVTKQIAGAKVAFLHDTGKNATLSRMPSLRMSFETFCAQCHALLELTLLETCRDVSFAKLLFDLLLVS